VPAAAHDAGGGAPLNRIDPAKLSDWDRVVLQLHQARHVPEWQFTKSHDAVVLRAEVEWLEAEDRASVDLIDELLADLKRAEPDERPPICQRLRELDIVRGHTLQKLAAVRALLESTEAAASSAARAPAPSAAVAPTRVSGVLHVAAAAQRMTAAASKAPSAGDRDGDDVAEPVAPGCPSLLDAAVALAPLRIAMQRVVDAACGAWLAGTRR
jgi:hypothetical protein